MAFGDSTTAPRGKTVVYATLLSEELMEEGGQVHIVNAGVGGNYVASRTASSTVPYVPTGYAPNPNGPGFLVTSVAMKQVPGYWIFDAMLRRPITERLELQANVNNILNRYYIDLPHPSHLIPGAGANALIGINFKF